MSTITKYFYSIFYKSNRKELYGKINDINDIIEKQVNKIRKKKFIIKKQS